MSSWRRALHPRDWRGRFISVPGSGHHASHNTRNLHSAIRERRDRNAANRISNASPRIGGKGSYSLHDQLPDERRIDAINAMQQQEPKSTATQPNSPNPSAKASAPTKPSTPKPTARQNNSSDKELGTFEASDKMGKASAKSKAILAEVAKHYVENKGEYSPAQGIDGVMRELLAAHDDALNSEGDKFVGKLSDELREAAKGRAQEIFDFSALHGEKYRADIREIVGNMGGAMGREFDYKTGLPTAVKGQQSLYRKMLTKLHDAHKKGDMKAPSDIKLTDGVRFTALFNEDDYWEDVQRLASEMKARGYEVTDFPPGWQLDSYRGMNLTFRDPKTGLDMEVQAHTPRSLVIAEDNHAIYEQLRDPQWIETHDDAEKEAAEQRMRKQLESIKMPKGVPVVQDRKNPDSLLFTNGPTGYITVDQGLYLARKAGHAL